MEPCCRSTPLRGHWCFYTPFKAPYSPHLNRAPSRLGRIGHVYIGYCVSSHRSGPTQALHQNVGDEPGSEHLQFPSMIRKPFYSERFRVQERNVFYMENNYNENVVVPHYKILWENWCLKCDIMKTAVNIQNQCVQIWNDLRNLSLPVRVSEGGARFGNKWKKTFWLYSCA